MQNYEFENTVPVAGRVYFKNILIIILGIVTFACLWFISFELIKLYTDVSLSAVVGITFAVSLAVVVPLFIYDIRKNILNNKANQYTIVLNNNRDAVILYHYNGTVDVLPLDKIYDIKVKPKKYLNSFAIYNGFFVNTLFNEKEMNYGSIKFYLRDKFGQSYTKEVKYVRDCRMVPFALASALSKNENDDNVNNDNM